MRASLLLLAVCSLIPPVCAQLRAVVTTAAKQDISPRLREVRTGPLDTAAVPGLNFSGVGYGFTGPQGSFVYQGSPSSANGAAGLTQYVQVANISFGVFDKNTGAVVYGPVLLKTLWSGFGGPCEATNSGDPIVAYDRLANRWVITQVSATSGTGYFQCVAVSTSADATGSYYRYAFEQPDWNDFAKLGVWPDAYYLSFDMFAGGTTFEGARACALDRRAMLAGARAAQQCFQLTVADSSLLPSDMDGSLPPPAGSPNHFLELDPAAGSLRMWDFHVDWNTPANSRFSGPVLIPVAPFQTACGASKIGNTGTCVPQRGTKVELDSMGDRLMNRLAYRNFGDHESAVVNHSIAAGASVGVRWYELRNLSGAPAVFEQGAFAPDEKYRWLGSLAMDRAGDIALGYSISSPAVYPGIRIATHAAGDAPGTMGNEIVVIDGAGPQTGTTRWGDYSSMAIDPVDDCTFWYTNQYLAVGGTTPWSSRIASFRLPACPPAAFQLSASPSSDTIVPGGELAYAIAISRAAGFTGDVALEVSGVPAGCSATFAPNPGTDSAALTISTSSTTPAGIYDLTVSGRSGSLVTSILVAAAVVAISADPADHFAFGVNSGSPPPFLVQRVPGVAGDPPPVVVPGAGGAWLLAALAPGGDAPAVWLSLDRAAVAALQPAVFVSYVVVGTGYTARALTVRLGVAAMVISEVVDSAAYRAQAVSPEGLFTILGANLAAGSATPGGASVNITDSTGLARPALVSYVSPGQINLVAPADLAAGSGVIRVVSAAGWRGSLAIQIRAVAPGLFSADQTGGGLAAALVSRVAPDGSIITAPVASFDPGSGKYVAVPIDVTSGQVYLSLFGTGIRGRKALDGVLLTVGDVPVQTLYAGAQPEYPGLDQINVSLPPSLGGRGEVEVKTLVDGLSANTLRILVR